MSFLTSFFCHFDIFHAFLHLECAEVARVEDLGQGGDDDGDCRRVVRRHPGNQRQGLFFILPITNMPAPPSQNYPVAPLAQLCTKLN